MICFVDNAWLFDFLQVLFDNSRATQKVGIRVTFKMMGGWDGGASRV